MTEADFITLLWAVATLVWLLVLLGLVVFVVQQVVYAREIKRLRRGEVATVPTEEDSAEHRHPWGIKL